MKRIGLFAVLPLTTLLIACGGASASTFRDCGQWMPGGHPTRVQASAKTSCDLAKTVGSRVVTLTTSAGAPFEGRLHIGRTALRCKFHRRGHVVYTCTARSVLVRLWAAERA